MYKFVYAVSDWWIVIGDGCHFYYHLKSGERRWQFPDDLNVGLLDFDYLGLLFAKARGLKVEVDNEDAVLGKQPEEIEHQEIEHEQEHEEHTEEEHTEEQEEPVEEEQSNEEQSNEEQNALNLGYLSSDDSEEETPNNEPGQEKDEREHLEEQEEEEHPENDEEQEADEEEEDVDDFVNNLLNESENESDSESENDKDSDNNSGGDMDKTHLFESLLDEHQSQIDSYNPYSLVEEDLIQQFVKHPVFYQLLFQERENIYNQWAAKVDLNPSIYPSEMQKFYQKLFEFKSDIKLKYYIDFKQTLHPFNVPDKQKLFLTYKNMLQAQTTFEKANRTKYPKDVNLKKLKLSEYLRQHLTIPLDIELEAESDFEKWIELCNKANIPREVAENQLNWLVGDTKRLECYLGK